MLQQVNVNIKKCLTKVLEVIIKTPYLCTTPQGRDGCFERRNHEKKKGLSEPGKI